jgi:uncharacterized protein (DUF362 family)
VNGDGRKDDGRGTGERWSTDRRRFLAATGITLAGAACSGGEGRCPAGGGGEEGPVPDSSGRVALADAGDPARNGRALLDAWGGVEGLVGPEDVVIFKVNSQWYAQGMTNTNVLESLVRAVLERPGGFSGEVVVADNHHFKGALSRGWTTEQPNGRHNLVGLVEALREEGHERVARVHWRDAGPNPDPWQGDDGGGTLITEPGGGDGYRWWLEECHVTPDENRCPMTWPVFTLPLSGDVVDLRDGVYRDGRPTGRPVRMINISSLNHHSRYAGVTASIKNLMGVVDMTCGFQGPEPPGYFNTHYIGMRPSHGLWRWAKRREGAVKKVVHKLLPEENAIDFHHTGGALGHWMRTVRRPDLHVVTAEWVGFGSRTVPELSVRPGVSLASDDPVTLDAVAAREVLLPATRQAGQTGRAFLEHNDPDAEDRPFRKFLLEARREVGGRVDPGGAELVRVS